MTSPCHTPPLFGEPCCVKNQFDTWAATKFQEWRETYTPPKCAKCGGPMAIDGSWYVLDGKLMASIFCINLHPKEKYAICGDQDRQVVIA